MVSITGYAVSFIDNLSHHISNLPTAESVLFGMASILLISAIGAFVARFLKQPLIPAYVIAGLIAGPLVLGLITSPDLIYAFLEIGIVFLLFTAGLEISFRKIKEANLWKILAIGTVQVAAMFAIVFFAQSFFGLSTEQAIYMGIVLAFSSTMVDIKLLSDRNELSTLHGRLVLGILLLQDLVAIIAIALLTTGGFSMMPLIATGIKLLFILLFAFILQKFVLTKLFRYAAESTELLFISSLGVLFSFIIISYMSEISIAIGAFIAGVSLANSPFKTELESRISPVKDFFAILFFVSLGMQITFSGLAEHITLFITLIVGALIIKPIILFTLFRFGRYQQRTSFHASASLAQLSEFSLIIGILGITAGVLTESLFSTIILATVITMSLTPYIITKKDKLFKALEKPLNIFKVLPQTEVSQDVLGSTKSVLLVGSHRIGASIIQAMNHDKNKLIVIDHNPEVTKGLTKQKIANVYGDIMSPDILNNINIKKLKLVICTLPGLKENMSLLKRIGKENPRARIILNAQRISEAKELYAKGADYVTMPKVIAGKEIANLITKGTKSRLRREKKEHLKYLEDIHKVIY